MNGPTAAVVIFFLLMFMKHLLLSLTPLLRYDTHTYRHTDTHTHTHTYMHTHALTDTHTCTYTSNHALSLQQDKKGKCKGTRSENWLWQWIQTHGHG